MWMIPSPYNRRLETGAKKRWGVQLNYVEDPLFSQRFEQFFGYKYKFSICQLVVKFWMHHDHMPFRFDEAVDSLDPGVFRACTSGRPCLSGRLLFECFLTGRRFEETLQFIRRCIPRLLSADEGFNASRGRPMLVVVGLIDFMRLCNECREGRFRLSGRFSCIGTRRG